MDNLFAYLGKWGSIDTLTLKNSTISELLHILFPKYTDFTAGGSFDRIMDGAKTPDEVADAIFSYFNEGFFSVYLPYHEKVGIDDQCQVLMNSVDVVKYMWKAFSGYMDEIEQIILDEMKYVMVMSYIYTQTLYDPRVGTENPITACYHLKKRTLSGKAQNYTGSKTKYCHQLLHSIIYRRYDKKHPAVVQSALDFGIILGLVTATTAKHNPYVGKKDTPIPADIKKFLNGFQHAPISEKNATDVVDGNQYLYRKTSPQYIMLFNQWAVERFTNVNYLINVFDFTNTLDRTYYKNFEALFQLLMVFPLPKTRITIVQQVKKFISWTEEISNPNYDLKGVVYAHSGELAKYLEEMIIKLMEIALPILVLTFHYAMHQYTEKNSDIIFGFTEYFQHLRRSQCYEYVVQKKDTLDTTQSPYQMEDMDPERYKSFVKFAAPYYQIFIDETNDYTEEHNFQKRFDGKLQEANALYFRILSDTMLDMIQES